MSNLFVEEIKILKQIHSKLAFDMLKLRELLKQFNSVKKTEKTILKVSITLKEHPDILAVIKSRLHLKTIKILEQLSIYSSQLIRFYLKFSDNFLDISCCYQFIEEDIFTLKGHINRLKILLDSLIMKLNEKFAFFLNKENDQMLICDFTKELEPELIFSFENSCAKAYPNWGVQKAIDRLNSVFN